MFLVSALDSTYVKDVEIVQFMEKCCASNLMGVLRMQGATTMLVLGGSSEWEGVVYGIQVDVEVVLEEQQGYGTCGSGAHFIFKTKQGS